MKAVHPGSRVTPAAHVDTPITPHRERTCESDLRVWVFFSRAVLVSGMLKGLGCSSFRIIFRGSLEGLYDGAEGYKECQKGVQHTHCELNTHSYGLIKDFLA